MKQKRLLLVCILGALVIVLLIAVVGCGLWNSLFGTPFSVGLGRL